VPPSTASRSEHREGSPFTGVGPVFVKELADHLSSTHMTVLMLFVIVLGAFPVAMSLKTLRTVVGADAYLFLRIFTIAPDEVQISFVTALNFLIPLMAIGLGFDSVNSEFNRRTLSRVLSQPIYRDALLIGKFLSGLATLAISLMALWLIVFGAGLLMLGLPPRGVEVARGLGFLLAAIAYGGVWLAISMLFSVMFRSTATSALCSLGLWLFFFILWPMIASSIAIGFAPTEIRSADDLLSYEQFGSALMRVSPGTLFSEAVVALLNPETRVFGDFSNLFLQRSRGAIPNAPLPLDQSLLLIWPQITGLIAGMIVVFAVAYVIFQREEVRA
jgi:ABC-2 type transport system permease protein